MNQLEHQLEHLVACACDSPPNSPQRQRFLQELHYCVTTSGKLWWEAVPYYNDALQDMWVYCFQNLEAYDSNIAGVITWLDANLRRFLRRYRDRAQRDQSRHLSTFTNDGGEARHRVDTIPSPPDVSPWLQMWEQTVKWVRTDPDDTLTNTYFRQRPEINAQTLFLLRFPDETPWKAIAAQFNLTPAEATDLPKFYNRRCRPLLRAFGKNQGYLDS
ncbi:MAG: sigma-70 family RNA polymerase sigma factor [Cyanothece sp. SIO2G6]|nr:sigma-70 family RNA polymerase sigma factor [Cyanothece sp. SIO2G6]